MRSICLINSKLMRKAPVKGEEREIKTVIDTVAEVTRSNQTLLEWLGHKTEPPDCKQ